MPERIQLKRTRGWRMPPNTVVVSRPSKWGNPHDWREWRENWPFDVRTFYLDHGPTIRDRWCKERAVQAFEEDLADGTLNLPVEELRGKSLACWCKPSEWCHADVLLKIANR